MLQITGPLFPEPTLIEGSVEPYIGNHPAYCTVCMNLNPATAMNMVVIRSDVKAEDSTPDRLLGTWEAMANVEDVCTAAKEGCHTCQLLEATLTGILDGRMDMDSSDLGITFTFCVGNVLRIALGRLDQVGEEDDDDDDWFGMSGLQERTWKENILWYEVYVPPGKVIAFLLLNTVPQPSVMFSYLLCFFPACFPKQN